MRQRPTIWFVLGLLLVSLACNAFAGEPAPLLPPPPGLTTTVPLTPPSTIPGLAPTVTLPATAVPLDPLDPNTPQLRALVDLNIRSGPSVQYNRVGFLRQGQSARIIGRNADTGWWRIQCPPPADGEQCWVSGGAQYTAARNTANVPDLPAPPR